VAKAAGLNPRVVIAVDLFGQPADYYSIMEIAQVYRLKVLADAAQSFGATLDGKRVGTFGDATATSFFPAKPLGCYGDGGAILINDHSIASVLESIRMHGKGSHRYEHVRVGINGRLDTMQAAILLEKLNIFDDEIEARNRIAARYAQALSGHVVTPEVKSNARSVWAQYTICIEGGRDLVAERMRAAGVPTAIHYPIPLHHQPAYRDQLRAAPVLPIAEMLSDQVLSLPMHPYLEPTTQDYIVEALVSAVTS